MTSLTPLTTTPGIRPFYLYRNSSYRKECNLGNVGIPGRPECQEWEECLEDCDVKECRNSLSGKPTLLSHTLFYELDQILKGLVLPVGPACKKEKYIPHWIRKRDIASSTILWYAKFRTVILLNYW
jgi:hypothetical protein